MVKKLVNMCGSKNIMKSELPTRVKNALFRKGIKTNRDLLNADKSLYNSLGEVTSREVNAYINKLILTDRGINLESDIFKPYPANILGYILKNCEREVLDEKPFSSVDDFGNACQILISFEERDFSFLTPRESKIVKMYFKEHANFDIIACNFDVSKDRIIKILEVAVSKIMNLLYCISNGDSIKDKGLSKDEEDFLMNNGIYTLSMYNSTMRRLEAVLLKEANRNRSVQNWNRLFKLKGKINQ